MKRKYISLAAILLTILAYSCKKPGMQKIAVDTDGSTAQMKFFNFGVSQPTVNFYANTTKISATLSATGAESTTGVNSGLVFPASNYAIITPGSYTFKAQVPSTATADANAVLASLTATVEAGKYYSLYTCGLYNTSAKSADAFMLEDVFPATTDFSTAYVHFINVVPNAPAAFSLYVKNTVTGVETAIATSIAYKAGSAFVQIPPGIYELYARFASAPTVNVISRNGTSVVNLTGGRFYTFAARGDYTLTSKAIDFTANK